MMMSPSSFATTLLQLHLGLGFVLGGLGITAASSQALAKQLTALSWEATLRAAAKAVGPVPLLATAALLQAQVTAPDILTFVGLLVSSTAVCLNVFLTLLGEITANARADDPSSGAPRAFKAERVLNACRAFGQTLLIFGAMPASVQLASAACFVRLALAMQAFSAASRTLPLPSGNAAVAAIEAAEPAAALAPVFAAVALLDRGFVDGSSLVVLSMQPALYGLVYTILVLTTHLLLGGGETEEEESSQKTFAELDQKVSSQAEPLRAVSAAVLHLSMAVGFARMALVTFSVKLSVGGFSIQWGDPSTSTAVMLSALILGVPILEYAAAKLGMEVSEGEAAGAEATGNGAAVTRNPTAVDYLKALVAPAQPLLLALLASKMMMLQEEDDVDMDLGALDRVSFMVAAPFRYGFVLAATAVWLQVVAFLVWSLGGHDVGSTSEPPFDVTGTLQWAAAKGPAKRLGEAVHGATHALLEGGLLLGCIGLGPVTWVIGGFSALLFLHLAAPPQARTAAQGVAKAVGAALLASGGSWFTGLEAILEKRRQAQSAAADRKAAEIAKALVGEIPKSARSAGTAMQQHEQKAAGGGGGGGSLGKKASKGKKK